MSEAPGLYVITDRRASARPLPDLVAAALEKVDPRRVVVQLREKDLGGHPLLDLGRGVLQVCRNRGVPLLINDRIDVALALGADGVHLGGGSVPAREVRRLWPGARIGVSCHSPHELRELKEGADFATWGPVFETPSKAAYGPAVGTAHLPDARGLGVPLVALGGIEAGKVAGLKKQGFAGIACIRAVFAAHDPGIAAQALLRAFDRDG